MKRWSRKGTPQANQRMAELRQHKTYLLKDSLIRDLKAKTGRSDWWARAQADGLTAFSTQQERIEWLQREVAK